MDLSQNFRAPNGDRALALTRAFRRQVSKEVNPRRLTRGASQARIYILARRVDRICKQPGYLINELSLLLFSSFVCAKGDHETGD